MDHAVGAPEKIYRVEGMPGLGWATSRKVVDEFLEKWLPKERYTDWDVWMRNPSNRKGNFLKLKKTFFCYLLNIIFSGRECLIPDISRTYHFGENGLNVDEKMQGIAL